MNDRRLHGFGRLAQWLLGLGALGSALVLPATFSSGGSTPPRSVLFIGNSYTYVNNLPALVASLGAAASENFEVEICGQGSATLTMHLANGRCREALSGRRWDLVVLQEQSTLGGLLIDGANRIADPAWLFWPGVRQWDAEIRARGASTALYLTWPRRNTPELQDTLTHAYMTIGSEIGATVFPVGPAWQRFLRRSPDTILYAEDGSHPSPTGSYVAAATIVTAILDRKTPPASGTLVVHPAPDGIVRRDERQTVDVPFDARSLAHEVAWEVWREQRAAGGYFRTRPVAPPEIPSDPEAAAPISAAAGEWVGEWRLLAPAWTGGAQVLVLSVDPVGQHVGVTIRTREGAAERLKVQNVTIEEGRLRFTAMIGAPFPGPVSFACASRSHGPRCVAERNAPEHGVRLVTTWVGRRVDRGPAPR